MNIDMHAHYMPRNCVGLVDDAGRTYDGVQITRNAKGDEVVLQEGAIIRHDKGQSWKQTLVSRCQELVCWGRKPATQSARTTRTTHQ